MSRIFLRVYKSFLIEDIRKSLLIVGEVTANCASCSEMGLDPKSAVVCPHCGIYFKYIASRRIETHPGESFKYASRMDLERPDLILIDLSDYQKINSREKARDLLG